MLIYEKTKIKRHTQFAKLNLTGKKNTVQKRYQVSLGYIIEWSYKNSNYDIIEFENVEDYERCKLSILEYEKLART